MSMLCMIFCHKIFYDWQKLNSLIMYVLGMCSLTRSFRLVQMSNNHYADDDMSDVAICNFATFVCEHLFVVSLPFSKHRDAVCKKKKYWGEKKNGKNLLDSVITIPRSGCLPRTRVVNILIKILSPWPVIASGIFFLGVHL